MNIQPIQYPQTNFTAFIRKEAVMAYDKLDPNFLIKAEEQGITRGFVVSLINRLQLKPNAEKLTPKKLGALIQQKINLAFKLLNSGKSAEEIAKTLNAEKKRVIPFVNKQKLIQRNNDIAEAFLNGENMTALAERYNLSDKAIGFILKAKGIEPKTIATEKRNNIIKMVNEKYTDEMIADATGFTIKHIESIRAHNRLRKNKSHAPNPREQFIIWQLNSGKNRELLSQETGISMNIINNVSRKFKIKENILTERNEQVLQLLQENVPSKTIAKIFNIDKTTVYRIAKKYNFKLS